MNSKTVLLLIVAIAALLLPACSHQQGITQTKRQPLNIIYILADDLGYGDLGCYGQQVIETPNLDRMAAEGLRFTDHYAGSSVCAPSRASLMTGHHTGRSYVRGNYETGPFGFGAGLALRDEDVTVAKVLKKAHYHTALVGKWGLGVATTTGEPNRQGFDYSYGFLNQGHAHHQFPEYLFRNGQRIDIAANQNGQQGAFSNDLFTEEALSFLKKTPANQPFFLYLAYTTPHAEMLINDEALMQKYRGRVVETPFVKKLNHGPEDMGAYASQPYPASAYAAQITHLDRCVGKLLKALKENGLDDNTLVMFSSDNGPHAEGGASPAYFHSAGPLRGQKRDLYEGGIRVPFIVRWPGVVQSGRTSNHVSAFWDVLPTLTDIAGAPVDGQTTEGTSFVPTLRGELARQTQHNYLYWEFHENPTTNQAVRQGPWKAVRRNPAGPIELYNLQTDLGEIRDVASRYPAVLADMQLILNTARTPSPLWPLKAKPTSP